MMARELGIPSRVVVGFLDPSKVAGRQPVRVHLATTPTPGRSCTSAGSAGSGSSRPRATAPPSRRTPATSTVPTDQADQDHADEHAGQCAERSAATPTPPRPRRRTGARLSRAAPAAAGARHPSPGWSPSWSSLLAVTPGSIRWGIRRSRMARAVDGGESSEYAWLELRDRILDLRLPWTGSLTPRARSRFVEPLLGGDPDGVAALDRLSLTVERARYASSPVADASRPRTRARSWRRSGATSTGSAGCRRSSGRLVDARAARHLGAAARQGPRSARSSPSPSGPSWSTGHGRRELNQPVPESAAPDQPQPQSS